MTAATCNRSIIGTMKRHFRLFVALVASLSFLFAQATTAAYSCATVPDPVAMAQMQAEMGDDGGLCEKHCTTGTVSYDLAKPAASAMPAVAPLALRVVAIAPVARAAPARTAAFSASGPAPPLIRFTVLRI